MDSDANGADKEEVVVQAFRPAVPFYVSESFPKSGSPARDA